MIADSQALTDNFDNPEKIRRKDFINLIGEDHFDELEFMAGMLYQNDEAVAFTAGTRLDKETFDVHFEKALPDVEGAYTMINREFARLISSEYPEIE